MDAKITKQRLSHMLSYDWLKIVATVLGVILGWELIFTTSATRIMPSQQFGIYNYMGSSVTARFNSYSSSLQNVFSHEVYEIVVGDLTVGDEEYLYQITEGRLTTNVIDVVFAPDVEGNTSVEYQKEPNGEVFKATHLEDFLYRYTNYLHRLDGEDGYLKRMENYLNGYFNGDYKNGELNEGKIETDFRSYVANSKDKRYKNEESISLGVQGEIARIKGYRASLIDFYSYLDAGYIALTEKTLYKRNNDSIFEITGAYSINVCPNEKMEDLKRDAYYRVTDEESNQTKTTALNMNVVFIKDGSRESFEFENLAFVNKLVKTHCSELNKA